MNQSLNDQMSENMREKMSETEFQGNENEFNSNIAPISKDELRNLLNRLKLL